MVEQHLALSDSIIGRGLVLVSRCALNEVLGVITKEVLILACIRFVKFAGDSQLTHGFLNVCWALVSHLRL